MLTVNTTSSVVEPQAGWLALVTVNRSVTVPVPLTLTAVVALPGLRMFAVAEPVEPTTLHCGAPPEADPLTLNAVGLLIKHAVKSVPALAVGAGLSVTLAELLALHPTDPFWPGALTETDSTVVPPPPAVQVTVRDVCPLVIVPLVIVQLYPAPCPASGTDDVLPVETAHTVAGAVIVAETALLTAKTTSSLDVPQPALLLAVKRNVTEPIPATLTEVLALFWLARLAAAVPVEPTTVQAGEAGTPLAMVPLTVNAVAPLPVEQTVWSTPALAVGRALVVKTTSSAADPQPPVPVTVNRNVTVPAPVTLTIVLALAGLATDAAAEPVEPMTLQPGVPPETVPVRLKATVP